MSVAVVCNLSDGVIIGVDSAVTVSNADGIQKVFEDGEKLFRLAEKIGVATYGLAGLEGRSIGSFVREFAQTHQDTEARSIKDIVEDLRAFFMQVYVRFAESVYGKLFAEIPVEQKGALGLIVAGFSPNEFLSEVWEIQIPWYDAPGSAKLLCGPGHYAVNWFAAFAPIERYVLGFDRGLLQELGTYVEGMLGRPMSQAEIDGFAPIREKYGYRVMLDSMPIKAGVEYIRFLVQLAIYHYRFASPQPIVGGKAKIGVVTYKPEGFTILE